ncbi:MAG: GTP-binding protein [Betaproteobacteria bacterium]
MSTPVNLLTGFLGSGKTTLLQRLLRAPQLGRTAVLINEFGEVGLDHLLVQRVDEAVVLLESGCICCTIRGDLNAALRGLLDRRDRGEIPAFDRVVIETTGLADPGPILYTLLNEPVLRHHFRLGNVITTVDAVNAELHLSRNPEGIKQVAAADQLLITKSDLAEAGQVAAVREVLAQVNPSACLTDVNAGALDIDGLLDLRPPQRGEAAPHARFVATEGASRETVLGLQRHSRHVSSFSLVLDAPLDWTAFGVWLSLLLNRHGDDVLRVKGILQVQGSAAPVFINAVQHVVHPPLHLERWPTEDQRSRIVFITRGLDHALLRRSLEAFCRLRVAELSIAFPEPA